MTSKIVQPYPQASGTLNVFCASLASIIVVSTLLAPMTSDLFVPNFLIFVFCQLPAPVTAIACRARSAYIAGTTIAGHIVLTGFCIFARRWTLAGDGGLWLIYYFLAAGGVAGVALAAAFQRAKRFAATTCHAFFIALFAYAAGAWLARTAACATLLYCG